MRPIFFLLETEERPEALYNFDSGAELPRFWKSYIQSTVPMFYRTILFFYKLTLLQKPFKKFQDFAKIFLRSFPIFDSPENLGFPNGYKFQGRFPVNF